MNDWPPDVTRFTQDPYTPARAKKEAERTAKAEAVFAEQEAARRQIDARFDGLTGLVDRMDEDQLHDVLVKVVEYTRTLAGTEYDDDIAEDIGSLITGGEGW